MYWIYGSVLLTLLLIAWEDYKFRAVHWWLFLLLFLGLGISSFLKFGLNTSLERTGGNTLFVVSQLVCLTAYFSLKNKQFVNVLGGYFGSGDLCFLIAISIYFSFISFILFYIISLLMVILITLILKVSKLDVGVKIPLAGYQAVFLFIFMLFEFAWPGRIYDFQFLEI